ncbi:kunitz/BPTI-like toxin [Drosophila guanche]|uniref:Blast:Protease inhibitor n=1 Tax=Drosophila guanche TaxID=7266 RepID=A0A3B0J9W6_DROGU|nr:kunitz/BPTI-like toxin [Drosophila guanche]SPP79074.1 blast:Protease inhibitor [Drosophila guanche]
MRMTQFLCFGATLLLFLLFSLLQQTQAVPTSTAKPGIVAQVQPKPAGNLPPSPSTAKPQPQRQQPDPKCQQPLDPGPCRMSLDRFYYNKDTNACETFKFGGCRGNDNRFGFRQTCEDACLIRK